MKLKATVSLGRMTGGNDGKPIRLSINDDASGCRILDLNFSLEALAEILTNMERSGEGEMYSGPIGCTRENKTELVPAPMRWEKDPAEYGPLLAPFEVDGWKGYVPDLYNHHNGRDMRRVTFTRFIRPDGSIWRPSE